MMQITGRKCPYAIGLSRGLRQLDDKAAGRAGGVPGRRADDPRPLLLAESPEKVVLFTTGSCRDVAVAFNREPDLMRAKVRAVYFNIGRGPNEPQEECNVGYDPLTLLPALRVRAAAVLVPVLRQGRLRDAVQGRPDAGRRGVRAAGAELLRLLPDEVHGRAAGVSRRRPAAAAHRPAGDVVHRADVPRGGPQDLSARRRRLRRPAARGGRTGGAAGQGWSTRSTSCPCGRRSKKPRPQPGRSREPPKPGELAAGVSGAAPGTAWARAAGARRPARLLRPRVGRARPSGQIQNIVLTGPSEGRWEYVETGRWWRMALDRSGEQLDCLLPVLRRRRASRSRSSTPTDSPEGVVRRAHRRCCNAGRRAGFPRAERPRVPLDPSAVQADHGVVPEEPAFGPGAMREYW